MKRRTPSRKISTRDGLIYIATASLSIGGYLVYREVLNDGQDNNLIFVAFIAGGIGICVTLQALLKPSAANPEDGKRTMTQQDN
ncbi:hypothetical protein ACFLS1_10135 [Verrucomicrobiota bacterium]